MKHLATNRRQTLATIRSNTKQVNNYNLHNEVSQAFQLTINKLMPGLSSYLLKEEDIYSRLTAPAVIQLSLRRNHS